MTTVYPAVSASGTVTSFVPLATVFTPSSGCSDHFRLNGPSLVAFDPGYGLDIDSNVRCAPSAVTTWWEQGRLGDSGDDHTALSLGPFTCPYKWSTVVSSVEDGSSTIAMCCPSGYYLENGVSGSVVGDCLSDVSSGMILTYASTSALNSDDWHTKTTTLTQSSVVGAIAIVGWNIEMTTTATTRKTTSGSTSSPTPSSSTPKSLSPTSTRESSAISSSSPNPAESLSSSRASQLSPGAAAGIGVGVGFGVIGAVLLFGIICVMRRRKRRLVVPPPAQQGYGSMAAPPPLHELYVAPIKHELDHQQAQPQELPAES
ncbi:hypothetical protein F5Y08DRAFT_22980 [Xylaria arbuscula]|uniref:Uncharacterized protein n=1 Tax=Xylaria arbuscula TaxID=114810 RepID=A0A9W8NIU8_9PEZI|nr:hypothetical protein F5Y08DRAFT_22980 [Xylaria arbuscula]KAJ3577695.1 hypothetical protein NPX13_g2873 [Xylaria arbuscula]